MVLTCFGFVISLSFNSINAPFMLRMKLFTQSYPAFQERGNEIFRIEALSDAVFGFSMSLLIMALEVPESFDEFRNTIFNFPPFVATCALVFYFWFLQNRFFRMYGLNNNRIIFLNLGLLIIILIYAFPLKYLFSLLLSWLFAKNFMTGDHVQELPYLSVEDFGSLVIFFSIGYSIIWMIFGFMYWEAGRAADRIGLNASERVVLRYDMLDAAVEIMIGFISLLLALVNLSSFSGICFLLIPAWLAIWSLLRKKALSKTHT